MPQRSVDAHVDFDELTDLPTMMYFRRYAGTYVEEAHKRGRPAFLVYFNIENFSVFNERYGFEEGDKLLGLTAVAIQEAFPGFLLSRFSEDHFLLVCQSFDLEQSILDVREQLRSYGRNANVELKAGIYKLEDKVEIGTACDRAKLACDSIAHRYDRTYRWFDDALMWRVERSQYIESHIDRAIENGWIKVYFQPIVRTVTGEVCEFEALARWEDPHYGMLSPAVFIEVLEECRLIHKLDAYMVRKACAQWSSVKEQGYGTAPISVNLSRIDFELCDIFQVVEDAAHKYRMPHQMLHVEITESALNDNSDLLQREMNRFRKAGYQVWLDDFGSGYSSLNTLKDYVFDVVKIDMGFLREFETKPKSRVIIASIVNMAKQLGMQTLIEGVELPEQFDFLRGIGCEYAQGFLIGRPAPMEHNLERIDSGELVLANVALHGYYDRLGGINSLSATPFDFPWETASEERPLAEMLPLAIIEDEAGAVSFLNANDSFVKVLRDAELGTMADLAERINSADTPQARIMRGAIDAALSSERIESVDLLENGHHCVMRLRRITGHDNVSAMLVSIINFSRFSEIGEERRLQIALRYLYAVYDEVNIVDTTDGTANTLYRGNVVFPSLADDDYAANKLEEFASTSVHPKDRARFREFMDLETVEARVLSSDKNYLIEAFRAQGLDGMYLWFTNELVPIVVDGVHTVLICTRRASPEVAWSIQEAETIPKSLLWDTLLDLVPAGVFWKDVDRRFVGVNKHFLDFYDFKSTNDVLGKTDEDMGWHVNVDPFKNIEMRVIQQGEPVINAHGTCISQGEVHDILASKIPLRRNGQVVGLLGYFTEDTGGRSGSNLLYNGFDRMAETDRLTGIPNMRGLQSSLASYQDSYRNGGPDFVCVALDIRGMGAFNNVYGRSFGNRILKVVAQRLTKACGVDGVVARIGGDKFAMLHQVTSSAAALGLSERAQTVVEGIREVNGIRINLKCAVGSARYSQTNESRDLLSVAEERMRRSV